MHPPVFALLCCMLRYQAVITDPEAQIVDPDGAMLLAKLATST